MDSSSALFSSTFGTSLLPWALFTLAAISVSRFVVFPLVGSPLNQIPNAHWSAPFSSLWILSVRYKDAETETVADAHKKFGPVVRLGPNDVSIDSIDYVKTVYSGPFNRTKWYGIFDNYGVPCMFSVIPVKEHAMRKRMVSHVYSKSFLQASPAAAGQARAILLDRLLPILADSAKAGQEPKGVEMFQLFQATSMDFITSYIYGLRGGTDFLRNPAAHGHWIQTYLTRFSAFFFQQELPELSRMVAKCGIFPLLRSAVRATNELADWNQTLFGTAAARLDSPSVDGGDDQPSPEDEPTVVKSFLSAVERENTAHGAESVLYNTVLQNPRLSAQSEVYDHIIAGQETTASTLAYLAWQLSVHQDVQDSLRAELLRLKADEDSGSPFLPDARTLDGLPVLHAVIMETLRLYAPFDGPLPRQTPASGCQLGPYRLPGGVRIAALAHTLHRESSVFPDPETWDYTRWTGADDKERNERNRQFWAFGSGGRMCIGSHFAMQEIKAIIAAIYSRFKTLVVDDSSMDPDDAE
ncbi:unspecific monooxygenase [Sporothrix brasiliensis 5110]|uniref:Unspecific monooxygenase n=1 Tax=Sporothrix brasiliensis 5110 TaxID=1398154 RepID=A0A0C2JBF3_9PEZI|nr:unspecific monooxygenase [Sporothrix brasiliensis 5110]KIH94192.1 unspecific monooxygenase [Sporothrix brasiliensis 5110]